MVLTDVERVKNGITESGPFKAGIQIARELGALEEMIKLRAGGRASVEYTPEEYFLSSSCQVEKAKIIEENCRRYFAKKDIKNQKKNQEIYKEHYFSDRDLRTALNKYFPDAAVKRN